MRTVQGKALTVLPLFRFDGSLVANSEVLLEGSEGHHAASVRRMRSGEAIQLTDGKGTRATGMVTEIHGKSLTVKVESVQSEFSPAPTLSLVQAVAKGDRDELAIQAATELGVVSVIPWQANRSVSNWSGKEQKSRDRWQAIVDEAAKQSLRSIFPNVEEIRDTKSLVKTIQAAGGQNVFLVLDPTAALSLPELAASLSESRPQSVALVVGPEGGISDTEVESLVAAGATAVHLGTGTLRTSTAGVAALAFLSGSLGFWG
ncbi:MAG: 16S rRNA (uracil(1498)-N(3))-methyltransferase [Microbacteriaceae bacterium]